MRSFAASLGLALAMLAPLSTQAQVFAEELRVKGIGPDAQLSGGVGFGLGGSLDLNVMSRLRLGALIAHEPWIVNFGITGELGALAGWGLGAEVELNHFAGIWMHGGFSRVEDDAWMSTAALGWTIFGVEWQHRYASAKPSDALMAQVRFPIGIWWFLIGRHDDEKERNRKRRLASSQVASLASPPEANQERPEQPRTTEAERLMASERRERAGLLIAEERWSDAERALTHAYALDPRPSALLRLADVEEAQGKLVEASNDLRRFLDDRLPAESDKTAVRDRLALLMARLAHLRLTLVGATGDERIEVDGQLMGQAALGYDYPLNPGRHLLVVKRGDAVVTEHAFEAKSGVIERLELQVPAVESDAESAPAGTEP